MQARHLIEATHGLTTLLQNHQRHVGTLHRLAHYCQSLLIFLEGHLFFAWDRTGWKEGKSRVKSQGPSSGVAPSCPSVLACTAALVSQQLSAEQFWEPQAVVLDLGQKVCVQNNQFGVQEAQTCCADRARADSGRPSTSFLSVMSFLKTLVASCTCRHLLQRACARADALPSPQYTAWPKCGATVLLGCHEISC